MKRFTILCLSLLILSYVGVNAQTTYTDNFDNGVVSADWAGNGAYGLTETGGVMNVKVNAVTVNSSFSLNFPSNVNISGNPVLNLKLRTNTVCIMKITLTDASNATSSQDVRIPVITSNLVNYALDFSAATFNKTAIKSVSFSVNYFANGFGGTLTFEDFILGGTAVKLASLSPIQDVKVFAGKTSQKIIVTDIKNASAIAVSGQGALMSGISYSAISGGVCTITYTAGTAGTAPITVTATGTGGFSNNTSVFNLVVEDNILPTIDQAANAKMAVGKLQTIDLTGITDGNTSLDQTITVTATSSLPASIPNPTITYTNGSPYATLSVNPTAAGTATITVTVNDDGASNNTKTMTFTITSYAGFNYAPTIDAPASRSMYLSSGTTKVKLTGLGSGDAAAQTLTIVGTGKHASVISAFNTDYTQGRDTAILTLTAAGLGKDTITVSVTDNGNNGTNNGNQTTQVTFIIDVLQAPPTAYKVTMNTFTADTTAKLWSIESSDVTQKCVYLDSLGIRWIKITMTAKSNWSGIWYNLPKEVDVSKAPYMSYQIMAKGFSPLQTHAYFWDVDTTRNTQGAHRQRDTISSALMTPHKVFMDFRNPLDQINDDGVPMNMSRVVRVLFNYHDKFLWPNNTINGVVWIGDIRIGDSCKSIPVINPVCTIDPVPTKIVWAGSGQQTLQLTGISNGKGATTGVTFTVLSSKAAFVPVPTLGTLGTDGKVTMTFTPGSTVDSSTIVVRVNATGSSQKEIRFIIKSVSDVATSAVTVNVDATVKGQTIAGFGGFDPPEYLLDQYAQDQGCTMMRTTIDGSFEKSNDNSDPAVLNRAGFNMNAVNFDYYRKAAAAGVTDIFVTLWAPPGWMMQSLSEVSVAGAPAWGSTTQKADPLYYDDYVEYMVAIVKMIKEESGIEIAGFCPQNEPAFTEPYGSAILDPVHMAELCGKLGKRFADEGLKTKPITSEQVFSQNANGYSVVAYANSLNADVLGVQYGKVVGNHYPDANTATWVAQYNACKANATYPKELWSTECTSNGNDFNAVMNQAEYMLVGMNNGCGAWVVWGYNQGTSGSELDLSKKEGMTFGYGRAVHYWAFKNFARYIRKGAVQLKSTSGNSSIVVSAFKHDADSTMTIVLLNKDTKTPYSIKLTGSAPATGWDVYRTSVYEKCEKIPDAIQNGVISLAPRSITTLYMKTSMNHAPTIDKIVDKFIVKNGSGTANMTGITCGDPGAQVITITATSSDPSIVPNPVVTYTSPNSTGSLAITPVTDKTGEVTITVTVKDNGGTAKGGVDQTTITFKVTIPSGGGGSLDDVSDKAGVYPNPADDRISISVPSELEGARMIITNVSGQVVAEKIITAEDSTELNVGDLSGGTYMITISNDKSVAKLKFMKK